MNRSATALLEQAGRYVHLFDGIGGEGRFDEAPSDGPIRLAPDQELVRALAVLSRLARQVEAERVKLAGEIGRRSAGDKETSLARRAGTTGAADLVAQVAGIRHDHAGSIVALGDAVRMREALSGEALEPAHPHIAAALADGLLDRVVASAMVRALRKAAPGLTPGEALQLEAQLVAFAQEGHTVDVLLAYCKKVPEYAHPEGAEGREQAVRDAAKVTKRALENGLTRWVLDLDPVTAGLFGAALEASTARSRFRIALPEDEGSDEQGEPEPEPEPDRRSLPVRRVDALALLARTALKVDDGQVAGTAVTMLVHIGLHELLTGIGAATISGVEGTISAATARKLACEAEIIPVVLGGDSQPLDLGTARRFFTEAQRRAMAARDQGCAGPSCDAPLSWTQAAHIAPAGYGPTSVDNGILGPRSRYRRDAKRRDGRATGTLHALPPAPRRRGMAGPPSRGALVVDAAAARRLPRAPEARRSRAAAARPRGLTRGA